MISTFRLFVDVESDYSILRLIFIVFSFFVVLRYYKSLSVVLI